MAAGTQPRFVTTPKAWSVLADTANTNLDGTGDVATVMSGGTDGSLVEWVKIKARVTTTAGMVRLYHHNGASSFLIAEIPVPAITISATVPGFEALVPMPGGGLNVANGSGLRASTEKSEAFCITANGGDF
jgi:hypothetical protein